MGLRLLLNLILNEHLQYLSLLGDYFSEGLWRWWGIIFRTMLGTFTIVPACVHHSAMQLAYMLLVMFNQRSCD